MALKKEAFIGNYLDETAENLQLIETGVLRLKKDPENEEVLNSILRNLHTIKGSSRMLKFPGMEQIAHAMENIFKGVKEQRYGITPAFLQVVFLGCDLVKAGCGTIRTTREDVPTMDGYLSISEKVYSNEPYDLEQLKEDLLPVLQSGTSAPQTDAGAQADAAGSSDYETIRVKLSSIDRIMQSMNQIVIKQFQFKKIHEDLHTAATAIQKHALDLKRDSATASQYRDYKELHKSVAAIQKSFSDQISVIERNTYELQEQLMRLTMLPLELIFGTIPRMVEEVSAMLGKDVECRISGTDVLLDKAILEKLYDPVIHIVRNSLDHGLETPTERQAQGKPSPGRLDISCTSEGGNITIRIKDDGRGIDRQQVARRALERNLISADRLEELSESDVYGLLFAPGFSTKSEVSDLSGRGIGLDIVRHNIQKVKGKITIQSDAGSGTEFLLSLPLSLATVSGFFIRSGEKKFLLPSNFVHKIVRLSQQERITYYNKNAFKLENQIIPLYSLSSLLGTVSQAENREFTTVIVVESVGEKIGVMVDAVLHHVQLIYKPLPRNLQRLKLIQGIVFDETYSIINILFVPELMKAFKSIKSVDILKGKAAARIKAKQVLVVDDSLNTREIEKSILELEGFEVTTANDGIDGLEKLKAGSFTLIITDIEMPRMDGITMVENIRKDPKHKTVPVIVISSHSDEAVRRSATEAGANAYIVKSDFDRNNFSAIARRLT